MRIIFLILPITLASSFGYEMATELLSIAAWIYPLIVTWVGLRVLFVLNYFEDGMMFVGPMFGMQGTVGLISAADLYQNGYVFTSGVLTMASALIIGAAGLCWWWGPSPKTNSFTEEDDF